MSAIKVAIPSDNPGGLEAQVSGHFGHCDLYTIVEIEDGEVKKNSTMDNPPHQEGGCLAPVQLLADRGVNILLAGGMGRRPLAGFNQAGIDVYLAAGQPSVGGAVGAFIKGQLSPFTLDSTCGGCGGH